MPLLLPQALNHSSADMGIMDKPTETWSHIVKYTYRTERLPIAIVG